MYQLYQDEENPTGSLFIDPQVVDELDRSAHAFVHLKIYSREHLEDVYSEWSQLFLSEPASQRLLDTWYQMRSKTFYVQESTRMRDAYEVSKRHVNLLPYKCGAFGMAFMNAILVMVFPDSTFARVMLLIWMSLFALYVIPVDWVICKRMKERKQALTLLNKQQDERITAFRTRYPEVVFPILVLDDV